ncbi:MAG: hypothetical protein SPI77_08440 [Corynebacterium sp.]|nr:hypothetical protein [Corynebacterium sp.]
MNNMDAARAERQIAGRVEVGRSAYALIAAMIVLIASLFFPHTGELKGWELLVVNQHARDYLVTLPAYIALYAAFLGVVVFSIVVLTVRAAWSTALAWLFTVVSLLCTVLVVWGTRFVAAGEATGVGPGLLLEVAGVLIAVVALTEIFFHRTAEQEAAAEARRKDDNSDDVARAQREFFRPYAGAPEDNPILIDDRRARAHRRHTGPETQA